MSFTPTHCRAARGLMGWSQAQLAAASKVATKTIADFERESRTPYERTLVDVRRAFEDAGLRFTNGGQPGVTTTPVWALHRLAERSNLDGILDMIGRGNWKISLEPTGISCRDRSGEEMGSVIAGTLNDPNPTFDPSLGKTTFLDRITPADLNFWITEMRSKAQRKAAGRPYSFRSSRASIAGKPGEVESAAHFVLKEDAVAAARSRFQAEFGRGKKVIFNPRLGFWWTGVDDNQPEQTFELRGPLGNAINELNIELNIQLEQE
jgi:transcriptional regulator with XRE-family HTH domain